MQTRRGALLLTLALLVHAASAGGSARGQAKRGGDSLGAGRGPAGPEAVIVGRGEAGLPPAVVDMRAAILTAVETGDVAELEAAIEFNELKPDLGGPSGADPIAHLRSVSRDGTGTDILTVVGQLLEGSWASVHGGRDIENGRVYVWPHLAEVPSGEWTAQDEAALEALVGPEEARAIIAARRYRGWRLSIGADGVWHMLTRVAP